MLKYPILPPLDRLACHPELFVLLVVKVGRGCCMETEPTCAKRALYCLSISCFCYEVSDNDAHDGKFAIDYNRKPYRAVIGVTIILLVRFFTLKP